MAIISRAKADAVLKHFDTIQAPKLLYSLDDTYYYLIIKNSPSHKEYYIVLDSLGLIEKLYYIKDEAKTRKQKRLKKQYQGLLSEAEPIFDLNKYHADFITGLSEPNYTSGRYSYFVVIDTDGKRYGEY